MRLPQATALLQQMAHEMNETHARTTAFLEQRERGLDCGLHGRPTEIEPERLRSRGTSPHDQSPPSEIPFPGQWAYPIPPLEQPSSPEGSDDTDSTYVPNSTSSSSSSKESLSDHSSTGLSSPPLSPPPPPPSAPPPSTSKPRKSRSSAPQDPPRRSARIASAPTSIPSRRPARGKGRRVRFLKTNDDAPVTGSGLTRGGKTTHPNLFLAKFHDPIQTSNARFSNPETVETIRIVESVEIPVTTCGKKRKIEYEPEEVIVVAPQKAKEIFKPDHKLSMRRRLSKKRKIIDRSFKPEPLSPESPSPIKKRKVIDGAYKPEPPSPDSPTPTKKRRVIENTRKSDLLSQSPTSFKQSRGRSSVREQLKDPRPQKPSTTGARWPRASSKPIGKVSKPGNELAPLHTRSGKVFGVLPRKVTKNLKQERKVSSAQRQPSQEEVDADLLQRSPRSSSPSPSSIPRLKQRSVIGLGIAGLDSIEGWRMWRDRL